MGALPPLVAEEDDMKILGWCTKCHRFKQVYVKVPQPGSVQAGVCDDCEKR